MTCDDGPAIGARLTKQRSSFPSSGPQAKGVIPTLSKCARVSSRHASADALSDLKNDSEPKGPPETITIQRCPSGRSPSALKTTEHPRSASHAISSTTSTAAPFAEDHASPTGARDRQAVSGRTEATRRSDCIDHAVQQRARATGQRFPVPQPRQIERGVRGNCGPRQRGLRASAEVGMSQVRPQLAPPRS